MMRRSVRFVVAVTVFALVRVAGPCPADDKPARRDLDGADSIFETAPLTIVFRKVLERPPDAQAHRWTYSINSAGVGELTIEFMPDLSVPARKPPTRQKFEVPEAKMNAIRQALRVERFFNLSDTNGPHMIHGGWTTLAVVAGPLSATRELQSKDWSRWNGEQQKSAASAMRLFVAVCAAVDPEAKVFDELPDVKRVVADLKK
jgi:hypothetical protein